MKNFIRFAVSVICIIGFVTSLNAANPVTKEYVDLQIHGLQEEINSLQGGGTAFTAGAGINITGNVISNTSPGITYTAGSGIGIVGNVISNTSPAITYTGGSGITVSGTTISSAGGSAEFVRTVLTPNNSVSAGTAFTIDTQVFNSVPSAIVASGGNSGTVYSLSLGTYTFDYEMSLGAAGSIGLYTGATLGAMVLDTNTVAGSTTATTWIHGRALVNVISQPFLVEVSPAIGSASVVAAGTDSTSFMARLTILKIT